LLKVIFYLLQAAVHANFGAADKPELADVPAGPSEPALSVELWLPFAIGLLLAPNILPVLAVTLLLLLNLVALRLENLGHCLIDRLLLLLLLVTTLKVKDEGPCFPAPAICGKHNAGGKRASREP
jgi:hypothetical protein